MPINDIIDGIKVGAELSGIKNHFGDGNRDIRQEFKKFGIELGSGNKIIQDWNTVFEAIDKRTYRNDFKIGDCIYCDFGKEGSVIMQIAAFDKDKLANGNGHAAITWIGKYCLASKREMNEPGFWFGTISNRGGWKDSDMRLSLHDVESEIEDGLYRRIAYVKKNCIQKDSEDKLWLLSVDEYNEYLGKPNISFSTNESFWLRDSVGKSKYYMSLTSRGITSVLANVKDGVLVCFCTN